MLPSVCDISLDKVVDDMNLPQKCFKSKGTIICMIIKLENIHVKVQYLYEGNQKEEKIGLSSEGM